MTLVSFGIYVDTEKATCNAQFLLGSPILARCRRERRTEDFRQGHDLVGEELLGLGPDTRRLALFELQE